MPSHTHDEYHVCANLGHPLAVRHRGGRHAVPAGGLTVIGPGETHTVEDPEDRRVSGSYQVLYLGSGPAGALATELANSPRPAPYFAELSLRDPLLLRKFLALHASTERSTSVLERDMRLTSFLAALIGRHASPRQPARPPRAHRAVALARDFLADNPGVNVSLAELGRVASLSPTHLARAFRHEVGVAPHAYQLQARVQRVKRLLLQGSSVSEAAYVTGFFDESHLARHFKKHVGVAPGSYVRQDPAPRD